MEFPIIHIILFIAMSLCPEKADTFSIKGPDTMITAIKTDKGWRENADGALWSRKGEEVLRVLREENEVHDVSNFVGAEITKFDWVKRDTYMNNFLSVQKTDGGILVSIDLKGRKSKSYAIEYKTSEHSDADQPATAVEPKSEGDEKTTGATGENPPITSVTVTYNTSTSSNSSHKLKLTPDPPQPVDLGDGRRYTGKMQQWLRPGQHIKPYLSEWRVVGVKAIEKKKQGGSIEKISALEIEHAKTGERIMLPRRSPIRIRLVRDTKKESAVDKNRAAEQISEDKGQPGKKK